MPLYPKAWDGSDPLEIINFRRKSAESLSIFHFKFEKFFFDRFDVKNPHNTFSCDNENIFAEPLPTPLSEFSPMLVERCGIFRCRVDFARRIRWIKVFFESFFEVQFFIFVWSLTFFFLKWKISLISDISMSLIHSHTFSKVLLQFHAVIKTLNFSTLKH